MGVDGADIARTQLTDVVDQGIECLCLCIFPDDGEANHLGGVVCFLRLAVPEGLASAAHGTKPRGRQRTRRIGRGVDGSGVISFVYAGRESPCSGKDGLAIF